MINTRLRKTDIEAIKEIIGRFPEIENAFLFGSRAKGNSGNGSDIDIALKGDHVSFDTIRKMR